MADLLIHEQISQYQEPTDPCGPALSPRYQVTKQLSSKVFVCTLGPSTVVVKTLSPTARMTGSHEAEWRVVSKLITMGNAYPAGIVACLELHHDTNTPNGSRRLLVMEYCTHGDLFTRLEQQPGHCLPEAQALRMFRQIATGIRHLHSIGFAHRDISLENVLLDANDNTKICDFGLSAPLSELCHGTVGKAQYMAPEVVVGMTYDGVAADVWSLGVVLFIMLTGSPLFVLAVPTDPMWIALRRVGVAGVVDRWGMKDRISSGTIALLASMLRVEPSHRPQSLDDVLRMTPTV